MVFTTQPDYRRTGPWPLAPHPTWWAGPHVPTDAASGGGWRAQQGSGGSHPGRPDGSM